MHSDKNSPVTLALLAHDRLQVARCDAERTLDALERDYILFLLNLGLQELKVMDSDITGCAAVLLSNYDTKLRSFKAHV